MEHDYYRFDLDGFDLHYFINTCDTEMHENTTLATMLQGVMTLFIKGFTPNVVVYKMLPALEQIVGTLVCISNLPNEVHHLVQPPIWAPEFDEDH